MNGCIRPPLHGSHVASSAGTSSDQHHPAVRGAVQEVPRGGVSATTSSLSPTGGGSTALPLGVPRALLAIHRPTGQVGSPGMPTSESMLAPIVTLYAWDLGPVSVRGLADD